MRTSAVRMAQGSTWLSTAALLAVTPSYVLADEPGVDTVTVYASKRDMALQDVPMSVSVLTAAEIDAAGINDIADIAARLTTFDQQHSVSATTTTFRIRRIGNLGNIPTFEPAVGLFVDGAYRSRSLLGTNELLDVQRVEVLSGPQGTLYGRSVSAGLVAIYTLAPSEEFEGRAEATGGWMDAPGTPSLGGLKLRAGGPLAEGWRASLAAGHSQHGNTLANALAGEPDANDENRYAVRGQLIWSPNEQLEVRLLAGYEREKDDAGAADVYLAPGAISSTIAALLRDSGAARTCQDNIPHNRRFCSLAPNRVDLEALNLTLLGSYALPNGWSLDSITAWDHYEAQRSQDDSLQLSGPILFYRDSEQGSSVQQELRLSSVSDEGTSWLAGISFYRNDYERGMNGNRPMFGTSGSAAVDPVWPVLLGGVPLALPNQLGIHDSSVETRYLGLFGDVTWPLSGRLSLSTGLRWQREEKRGVINNSITTSGASLISRVLTPSVRPDGQAVNGKLDRTSDDVTWSVTPQYRFSDTLMGYLRVAHGSKSGGFNTGFGNLPLAAREFDDEHVTSYELGARGSLADSRLRFSAAAFYAEYRDFQDAAFVATQFSVGNAARVQLKGMEFEGALRVGERLTLDLAISVADLSYARNTTGMCFPGRVPDGTAPGACDLSGEHPINAPVCVTYLGLHYRQPLSWGEVYARLDWSWTDRYNTSFSADPRLFQDAHSDIGARLGLRFGSAYEFILWGKNLLSEDVSSMDAVLNLFNDASYQSFMAEPRSYGMTIRVAF